MTTEVPRSPKIIKISTGKTFHGADPRLGKITAKEASKRAGVTESTIYDWVDKKYLEVEEIPIHDHAKRKQLFIIEDSLKEFLSSGKRKASDGTIIWSREERYDIAEEFAILRLDDPISMTGKLLDLAIERKLPPERHRKNFNLANDASLRLLLVEKFEEAKELLYGTPEPIVLQGESVVAEKLIIDIQSSLNAAPLSELVSSAARRLVEVLDTSPDLSTEICPVVAPKNYQLISEVEPHRPKQLRIALCGFLPKQAETIKKKFPDIDVVHVKNDPSKSPVNPPHADHIILNRKFSGHETENKLKASSNGKISFISGGIHAAVFEISKLRSVHLAKESQIKL